MSIWYPLISTAVFLSLVGLSSPTLAHNGKIALTRPLDGILIDAVLDDWPQDLPSYPIAFTQWASSPQGKEDFHGTFRLGYDPRAQMLYIAVEVVDDSTVTGNQTSSRRRAQDGCEISLKTAHIPGAPAAKLYRAWANTNGDTQVRPGSADPSLVTVKAGRRDQYHVYEWRLDLGGMGLAGTTAKLHRVIGFNLSIWDADGEGNRRGRGDFALISWGPGQRGGNRAYGLGDLILLEPGATLGQIRGQVAWTKAEGRTPPARVKLQSTDALQLVLDTDQAGNYAATLPTGPYRLEADDPRAAAPAAIALEIKPGAQTRMPPLQVEPILPAAFYRPLPGKGALNIHRGVNWVASNQPIDEYIMLPLVKNGVNWIIQTPFGWQRHYNSTDIRIRTDGGPNDGESDQGIEAATNMARRFGIKTLLKPHLWLSDRSQGKWRGLIEMADEASWAAWFASYRKFILHYARLAERLDIELLCIGTELHLSAVKRERDWRQLIATIRQVYSGKLVYAANWDRAFAEIQFWDALDYIGLQAYFPLQKPLFSETNEIGPWAAAPQSPSVEDLKKGWLDHLPVIEGVYRRFGKPILVTEIGYHSTVDAAIRPWEWDSSDLGAMEEGLKTQANAYEAFFQTFWPQPWFAGVYFWKWYPNHRTSGGPEDKDFTPQNKPAEAVMGIWYNKGAQY